MTGMDKRDRDTRGPWTQNTEAQNKFGAASERSDPVWNDHLRPQEACVHPPRG
jgi:hypothetical protein